jgi:N-acetylglucosamine-6-phosphate deacetylase
LDELLSDIPAADLDVLASSSSPTAAAAAAAAAGASGSGGGTQYNFMQALLQRQEGAVMALLQHKATQQQLVACSTHLHW